MLTKKDILEADDLQSEQVPVPEWGPGETVTVKALNAAQRDKFESSIVQEGKVIFDNVRAKLVALCVVDDKGQRIFTDDDVIPLGRKSAAVLDRIYDAAQRLSGITDRDVKELEKNSEAMAAADSSVN